MISLVRAFVRSFDLFTQPMA
jgi:hypothetical protein